jgi:hypothetical protein
MPLTLSAAHYKNKGERRLSAYMNTNVKSFFKDMKTVEPQFKVYYKMDFMPILCMEQEWGRHRIHCYIYKRISNFIAETVQLQNFHLVGRLLNKAMCTSNTIQH